MTALDNPALALEAAALGALFAAVLFGSLTAITVAIEAFVQRRSTVIEGQEGRRR